MEIAPVRGLATISGTAGLTIALRALAPAKCGVGVPATICPNVVAAILAAGCRPFFLDIERETFGLDPAALQRDIGALGAVIAVHALGQPCQIADIARICSDHDRLLLEDCAQADGASLEGRAVGSWGDAGIFSYGRGKIIDLGHGGLLTANSGGVWSSLRQESAKLRAGADPAVALDAASVMNVAYRDLYNARRRSGSSASATEFIRSMTALVQAPLAPAQESKHTEIRSARQEKLAKTVAARRRKSDLYRQALAGIPGLAFAPQTATGAPWRFNILLATQVRDQLLDIMLADRMKVSSWHPDIRPYLPASCYDSGKIVNASWYSNAVLNLWVDDETSEQEILDTARNIRCRLETADLTPADGD